MMFRVFVTLFFLLIHSALLAADCDAVFPGPKSFAVKGSAYILNTNQCNGSYNCSPVDFTYMTNVPPLYPSGSFNSTNISDGVYQHTSWGLGSYSTVTFTGSGTAVMYFNSSVSIGQNTRINPTGSPENVLIIVNGSVVINQNAVINANIYSTGSLVIYQNSKINGAVSVAGSLYVDSNSEFNYQDSYVDNMDAHGFCGNSAPVIPISCSASLPEVAFSDNFSNVTAGWENTNFNRAISNWPSDTITTSNGENADMAFNITGGELQINGAVTASGDNEYGMVSYDLSLANIDKQNVDNYAISSDITAHKSGTNNDVGLVFGYEDDSNYFLARWNKYGTSYSGNNSFPGVYRRLELVKVSSGNASLLASSDDFDVNDPFNFEVVVNDDGTAVCVNDTAMLYSATEQPILNDFGIFSYDNDVGVEVDNVEVRCDDCLLAIPKANYRFDDCRYSGAAGEVVDQTGNYNAKTTGNVVSLPTGQIEKAIELSNSSSYVETSIPLTSSFSVSTWFKKPSSNSGNRYFVLGAMAAGGDLLYLDRGTNWRWGVYNASFGTSRLGTYSFSSLDNDWHHMVLIHANNQTKLYIDGVLKDTINLQATGTLKYIGTSYDEINASNPQGFRAPLDEFMVFDGELSQTQISQIYAHQLAKSNYDGSSRAVVICNPLVGFYQFEQTDFNTNIIDTSGLDNHGFNIGGGSSASGKYCRAFDTNGTNSSSATNNAFSTGLDVDEDIGTKGTISFWFNSNTDWNQGGYNGGGERTLFDASNSNKYFTLEIQSNGRLRFTFEDSADNDFALQEPATSVRNSDTWYYISVTWDYSADYFQILVDGEVVAQSSINTNGQMVLSSLIFGDNASTYSGNNHSSLASRTSANGKFDEVRVYSVVKTPAEIQADMIDTDCVILLDHYQILHDGNGLTCDSETVTIKACSNSFDGTCNVVNESGSFTLNVTGANGAVAKAGTFVNGVGTVDFNYTTAEQVSFALTNESPAPAANFVCLNAGVQSCNMQFADAGFRFLYETNTNEKIGYQTSGDEFSEVLKLQAVENTNGVCTGVFNGDVNVNLSQRNITPAGTSGLPFQVNDGAIKNIAKSPTFTSNITLNFDNTSAAVIPNPVYQDAGEIRLYASYSDANISLVGNSNDFWVKPASLVLSATVAGDSLNNATASGAPKHIAGDVFDFTVSAVNRSGAITKNYRQGNIELNVLRLLPDLSVAGSVDGVFTYGAGNITSSSGFQNITLTAFDADASNTGVSSTDGAKYSEVGVIQIDLKDSHYGDDGTGSGLLVDANALTVGRFTPAYFKQTANNGIITAYHTALCPAENWVYSGQKTAGKGSIKYSIEPELTVTAYNSNDVPTVNYIGDFAKLAGFTETPAVSGNNIILGDPLTLHANTLEVAGDVSEKGALSEFSNAQTIYTLSDQHHFTYTRNNLSKTAPFDATFEIPVVSIIDSDNIQLKPDDGNGPYFENPSLESDLKVYFGRWTIENAYGPETSDLISPMSIEVFDGTKFVIHNLDSCTAPIITAKKSSNPLDLFDYLLTDENATDNLRVSDTSATISASEKFEDGLFNGFVFSAPNDDYRQGPLKLEYEVPTWLKYDWTDGNGPFTENPTSLINFGLYRGNDRIISWREVGN
ncbi:LamG domain-containing protein [Thalassotalea profundi]|uniref:DUF6701 domain-containing protein n=1 Tax=Thalassotalea profundi TaxID=2036687 RepID=A0ABQ3IZK2_9GAMM|nr:LamG domain-containing protein [Thalassotalea profundi]GHE99209.1 hypothetical protein GCM10011501_30950 [Thalassotalea profundi]